MLSEGSEDTAHLSIIYDEGNVNLSTLGSEENRVIVALRLHQQSGQLLPEIPHLLTLFHSCLAYASRVLLCVDAEPS